MPVKLTPARAAVAAAAVVALFGAAGGLALVLSDPTAPSENDTTGPPVQTPGMPWFVDVAAGIDFRHFDPATPRHFIQETMGSGLAWIDYDADGWPDLFCVQQGPVPKGSLAASRPAAPPTNRLYRNTRDGKFADVTGKVGLARPGFGMGAAVGDYDNDGFDDLLVTYFGGLVLYHNEPDGAGGRHFADVTDKAGLRDPHWATSAAWGDVDGDGKLDLYVCNYCEVNVETYPNCGQAGGGEPMICPPFLFPPAPHRLFRNAGNGTFDDITSVSGVGAASPSPGLAVAMVDVDADGRIDIYVANDMKPAFLFHNQGGGRFAERALFAGCGVGPDGSLIAGMCTAVADVDGSGHPSLFVTGFEKKPNVLFVNQGKLRFAERSMASGLGGPSIPKLAFGAAFFDPDLDRRPDLAVANGHIHRNAEKALGAPYAQEAQLFAGDGRGKFRDVSAKAGAYFREPHVGRGLAVADFDNDGRPDVAVSHTGGPIALLHNRTETANHWLRLELIGDGVKSNRNAIGARVGVRADKESQTHFVIGGGSYLSASDRRLAVGLGGATFAEKVVVTWPSGRRQEFGGLAGGRGYRLTEGKAEAEPR
jgi:hypothetical protein